MKCVSPSVQNFKFSTILNISVTTLKCDEKMNTEIINNRVKDDKFQTISNFGQPNQIVNHLLNDIHQILNHLLNDTRFTVNHLLIIHDLHDLIACSGLISSNRRYMI